MTDVILITINIIFVSSVYISIKTFTFNFFLIDPLPLSLPLVEGEGSLLFGFYLMDN